AVHPDAGKPRPVRLQVARLVAPESLGHSRPRRATDELADRARADRPAALVEDVDVHAEGGTSEGATLEFLDRGRREEATADLGAARDVDDRAAPRPHLTP